MMRSSIVTTVGVMLLAAASLAAQKPKASPEAWASGQIVRYEATSRTLVVKQGTHEASFVLSSDAHLMLGKKALQPSDLSSDTGREVKVQYRMSGATKEATRVEVSEAGPHKTSDRP